MEGLFLWGNREGCHPSMLASARNADDGKRFLKAKYDYWKERQGEGKEFDSILVMLIAPCGWTTRCPDLASRGVVMNSYFIRVARTSKTAVLPTRAHDDDAGLDLYADEYLTVWPGSFVVTDIGVAFELPAGTYGQILGRSCLAAGSEKLGYEGGTFPIGGVIDRKYRGSLKVGLVNMGKSPVRFKPGDKIAQLVIINIETPKPIEVLFLEDDTERGANGFGSTGR